VSRLISRQFGPWLSTETLSQHCSGADDGQLIIPREVLSATDQFLETFVSNLRNSLSPWSNLIESTRTAWGDRWVAYRMAVHAVTMVGSNGTVWSADSRQKESLCFHAERIKRAVRTARGRQVELTNCGNLEGLDQTFVLYGLFRWIAIGNLLRLSDALGTALDRIPDKQWRILAGALAGSRWRGRQQQQRQVYNPKPADLPSSMSNRLASLLLGSLAGTSADLIYTNYLEGYEGSDTRVLQATVEFLTERAFEEPKTWASALPKISHAYMYGVVYPLLYHRHAPVGTGRARIEVPLAEARRICADSNSYPLSLVGLAETALSRKTGVDAIPVGKVAARDEWFMPE
jgi:hypothetical protein